MAEPETPRRRGRATSARQRLRRILPATRRRRSAAARTGGALATVLSGAATRSRALTTRAGRALRAIVPDTPRTRALARRARPALWAVFPGERRVWLSSLVVLVPLLALLAHELLKSREYFTSTDSVGVASLVVAVGPHQKLCVPNAEIGGGSAYVLWAYATQAGPRPPMRVTVLQGGRQIAAGQVAQGALQGGVVLVAVPISPVIAASPAFRRVTVCVRLGAGVPTQFGGMFNLRINEVSPTVDGAAIGSRIGLWFLPRTGGSLLDNWPKIMDRLSLFRPGFASALFYWLLFLLGLPLLAYFGLRLLAVAEEPRRRIVLALALIAFASNAAWAVTTANFDSPDESEHFAYVETLAETGHAPDPTPAAPAKPAYAADEAIALDAVRHNSQIMYLGKPPWAPLEVTLYKQMIARERPPRNDGGGYSVATGPHSPLYYSLLVPGYELGHSGGVFTEMFWMRLTSALLGVLVPLGAYGVVRELAPRRRRLAVAAGLLVAFEPMYTFISGAVNNDAGVNAAAAVLIYLVVRALRRGLTWPVGIALGVTAAVLPLMKGTGYALYIPLIVAVALMVTQIRSLRAIRNLVIAGGVYLATDAIWQAVATTYHRSAVTIPGGTSGGTSVVSSDFGGKLVYLWEVFFPRLPFMHAHWNPGQWPFFDIYVGRGIGGLGWYSVFFSNWVYKVVVSVIIAAGVLALVATWRRWPAVRARWRELIFLMLAAAGVIAAVEYVYYSPVPRLLLPEQGRYAFTALVPIAALSIAGLFALPRRWAVTVATMLVSAMIVLAVAARVLYLTATYT